MAVHESKIVLLQVINQFVMSNCQIHDIEYSNAKKVSKSEILFVRYTYNY